MLPFAAMPGMHVSPLPCHVLDWQKVHEAKVLEVLKKL